MSKMALDLFLAKDGQKGFTLMELLVVIAIFALIASIVFVISWGALDSAKIAKGLQFSQHLQNSLGAYAVGIWKFDEGTGTTANDTSGWENHGTLVNGPVWRCASVDPSYTPSGQGCSLEFNGSNQYVNAGNDISFNIVEEITIEAWVKRKGDGTHVDYDAMFGKGLSTSYAVYFYKANYLPIFRIETPMPKSLTANFPVELDVWQHWVFTYDGAHMRIYLNGVQDNSITNTGSIGADSAPFQIGKIGDRSQYFFNGLIDEVHIYNTSLNLSQIQSHYYAGLQNLFAKGRISQEEYQQRLARI
jgi:prepilin-type N-terminal cleavage/methylation domain-containing protein